MNWSWRIGRIGGIDVYMHWTFLILLGWIAGMYLWAGLGWQGALQGVGFILAIFGCVVLHEFGHAACARRFGIGTHDITLLPIGGVARLERMPEEPEQEFWIALAGPAVNVAIAAVLAVLLFLIAIFVFLGAEAEAQATRTRSIIAGVRVWQAMMTRFRTLAPDDTLRRAADELLAGSQQDFPVVGKHGVHGILERKNLVDGLNRLGPAARRGNPARRLTPPLHRFAV